MILLTHVVVLFLTSCSHNRITFHPSFLSLDVILLSRSLFPRIFFCQYSGLLLGMTPLVGCPCQKSESMKTRSLLRLNTMSGLPEIEWTCLAKYIFRWRNSLNMIRSGFVSMERIFCMFFRRWSLVRLSIASPSQTVHKPLPVGPGAFKVTRSSDVARLDILAGRRQLVNNRSR